MNAEDRANYLTEAFETGDASIVGRAAGMGAIAERANLNRENLYRALSPDGPPGIRDRAESAAGARCAVGSNACFAARSSVV